MEYKCNVNRQSDEESQNRKLNFNLRPMVFLMAVSGCYNVQDCGKTMKAFYLIYKSVIIMMMLAYAIRCTAMLNNPYDLLTYISLILLSCLCIANCLISCKMFSKKYGFYRKSVEDIRKLTEIMSDNNINIDMQYYKRRNIAITITAILLPAVCVAVQAISYFSLSLSTQNYVHNYTSYQPSVTSPFEDTLPARVVLFVPLIVLNFPFAIPACFLMLISVLLLTIFNEFNKHVDHITKEDQTSFIINVDTLRSIHVKMCGITCDLDKDVRYFYGNIFLWIMLIGIVVLYILVKSTLQYIVVLILLYYFALTTTTLAAVTISASLVHVAAHASLDTIYNIDVKNANFDQAIQLNLFLSKLTGTQVGFTTCGLFTITKEFILTIAGVFLTYFAVLYTL